MVHCIVLYPYLILHSLTVFRWHCQRFFPPFLLIHATRFCQIMDDSQIHSNHRSKWKIIMKKICKLCSLIVLQWHLTIAGLPRKNSLIDIWIGLRFIVNNNSYRYTYNLSLWLLSYLWLLLLYEWSEAHAFQFRDTQRISFNKCKQNNNQIHSFSNGLRFFLSFPFCVFCFIFSSHFEYN